MINRVKSLLVVACLMAVASYAPAQVVGHEPAKSPYLDLEYMQELTVYGGHLKARHDPAGIAPLSRPVFGARWEWTMTGPLALSSDFSGAFGSRHVIDPLKPAATRSLGDQSNGVYSLDLALALNLTGARSWHGFVPQMRGGIGFVRSGARDDSTGFAFGTPFAWVWGGGLKYVPSNTSRFQIRGDITDRIFKLNYTDPYYRTATDNTTVLPTTTERSFYTHHTAFTIGLSYLFAR